MRKRIVAAWKVLRGELVAVPLVQVPSVWTHGTSSTGMSTTISDVKWPS
jgi:hypothetical protein